MDAPDFYPPPVESKPKHLLFFRELGLVLKNTYQRKVITPSGYCWKRVVKRYCRYWFSISILKCTLKFSGKMVGISTGTSISTN